MGDWATDSFDWDGTDVGLVGTGETAFDWLQKKGYISLGYAPELRVAWRHSRPPSASDLR